jgi:bifunctional DNase/RNase
MNRDDIKVRVKGVATIVAGCGVFLESGEKIIAIFVDRDVGASLALLVGGATTPRPLTHETIGNILLGLDAKVEKVVVSDLKDDVFYARIIVRQENELGKKVVDIDARPSDAIAIALQQNAPIFVSRSVWEEAEDMSFALRDEDG